MDSTQNRRHQLITEAQRARSPLPALMELEESPPAVPPKDAGYQSSMRGSRPTSASGPASGSKRKRQTHDDTIFNSRNGRLEAGNFEHTPKRSRSVSHTRASEDYGSTEETPMHARSLRRKKGSRNLSNLNLRHAASLANIDQRQTSPVRESRFQEGSLTDKPSEKPPSVFTRFTRTDSGNLSHVEELMADYHEGMPTPRDSVEETLAYEQATRDERVNAIHAQQKKEDGSGVFRFGKSLASAFNPATLWNRLWHEQKEQQSQAQTQEAERKAKQKAEAEARYAQLKSAGQLGLQPVSAHKAHDSAVALDGNFSSHEHRRNASNGSSILHGQDSDNGRDGSTFPESASRPLRSFASRLHLRKPSLQNLQSGLKRVKSDFNIGSTADRDSSPSVSPAKADLDSSVLRKSHSKYDLKKQNKLSKRVSDLESKLLKARSELNEALAEASPKPKITGRYERFTPSGTIKKPKFVPGALPTLHSEGVLFPEQSEAKENKENVAIYQSRPRKKLELAQAFDDIDDEDEHEETSKKTHERAYPTRTKGLSNRLNDRDEVQKNNDDENNESIAKEAIAKEDGLTALPQTEIPDEADQGLDDASAANDVKALTPNVKLDRKATKGKKRGSTKKDDATFKPDAEGDDDAEWDEAEKPKKKRKSSGKAEDTPSSKRNKKSPHSKAAKKDAPVASELEPNKHAKDLRDALPDQDATVTDAEGSEDELTNVPSQRLSLGSNDEPLEPVYEVEEETVAVSTNKEPSKLTVTSTSTSTHVGRNAVRSRSNSPHKRPAPVVPGNEEKVITRAARAAQHRRPRSGSPPPDRRALAPNTVTATPGQGDVPHLPRGATGSVESKDFEWPDDVF